MSRELPPGYSYALIHDESGEIDYNYALQAEAISEICDLGILSNKTLTMGIADCNGDLIAAVWTAIEPEEYSFDIAVLPAHQGKGVGAFLLDEHLMVPADLQEVYPDAKVVVDVVNPVMAHMLAHRGFAVSEVHQGHWIMRVREEVMSPYPLPEIPLDTLGVSRISRREAGTLLGQFGYTQAVQLEDGRQADIAITVERELPSGEAITGGFWEHGVSIKAMAVYGGSMAEFYPPTLMRWAPEITEKEQYSIMHVLQDKHIVPNTPEAEARRQKAAQAFAEELLNKVFGEELDRHTIMVEEITSRATHIHARYEESGTGKNCSYENVVRAAKSQAFRTEIDDNDQLALVFDGTRYVLSFHESASVDDLKIFKNALEQEQFDNAAIERERRRRMGLSHYKPLDFLSAPLSVEALGQALVYAEQCEQDELFFGRTEHVKLSPVQVVTLAEKHLFNLDHSPGMRKMQLLFQDENETIVQVQLNKAMPEALALEIFKTVHSEVEQNFRLVRENDPDIAKIKANMAAANAMLAQHVDPELEAYMASFRQEEEQNQAMQAEIVHFKPKR